MEPLDLLVACVEKLGGDEIEIARADTVNFSLCDIGAFAYVQKGGRLRGSVFIDPAVPESEMAEAVEWAEAQSVHACRVDAAWASDVDADGGFIRLLFERDLDPEAIAADDPLATEADILAGSWYGEEPHQLSRVAVPLRASDPTRLAPTNAWLLMGRQRSYPTQADISEMNRDATLGIYETSGPRQNRRNLETCSSSTSWILTRRSTSSLAPSTTPTSMTWGQSKRVGGVVSGGRTSRQWSRLSPFRSEP